MAGFSNYNEFTGASGGGELTETEETWVQTQAAGWPNGFRENITPTETPNGTRTDFTIPDATVVLASLQVWLNGSRRTLTTDYTASGTTVGFNTAPRANSIIRFTYRY